MSKATRFFLYLLVMCLLCGGWKASAQGPDDYGSLADGIQKLIDKAQEDVNRLQKQLDSEKSALAKVTAERDALLGEKGKQADKAGLLEKENKELRDRAGKSEGDFETAAKEKAQIKDSLTKQVQALQKELDEAKSSLASAEKALKERESRVKVLSDELAGKDRDCSMQKAALEKENKHLKAQLDRIKALYTAYTGEK